MKWYKHDPDAALAGMIGLTVEERGAYYTLIDLQYARAPHSDVTDELVTKALAVRPQTWQRLKAGLIAKGKVHEIDGHLTANRVEKQVQAYLKRNGRGQNSSETPGKPQFQREVSEAESAKINDLAPTEYRIQNTERAARAPTRPRRARSLFPEDWQPADLPPDQQADFERFADHARANGRLCADWTAAWRNWTRKTMQMRQQERPNGRRHGSVLDACDRLREKLNEQGSFAENYVPGSSGPKPLRLDQEMRPANPRLISPR